MTTFSLLLIYAQFVRGFCSLLKLCTLTFVTPEFSFLFGAYFQQDVIVKMFRRTGHTMYLYLILSLTSDTLCDVKGHFLQENQSMET